MDVFLLGKTLGKECPNSDRPVINLGRTYLESGYMKKAQESFEEAMRLNPCSEDAYYYMGVHYEKLNDMQKAMQFYEKSLSIDNEQSEVHLNLGICYYKLNSFNEALNEFEQAYRFDTDCLEAIEYKALAFKQLKDYDKALQEALRYNGLDDTNINNLTDIAYFYYKINNFKSAYNWINRAISMDCNNKSAKIVYDLITKQMSS